MNDGVGSTHHVLGMEVDDTPFGMRVLTRDLGGWPDAWLVELGEPIYPTLKAYVKHDSGIMDINEIAQPNIRHVVVNHNVVRDGYEETLVYPAYASGEARYVGGEPTPLAGGDACTHVDALHDLAARFVGLECDIEGERCSYAMGMNQFVGNRGVAE